MNYRLLRNSLLLLFLLNINIIKAQLPAILSSPDDSSKVKALLDLGYTYEQSNPDSAIIIYKLAEEISQKISYHLGTGKSKNYMGIVLFEMGRYTEAQQLYHQSIEAFEKVGYKRGIAANYNNLGNIFLIYNDLDHCLEHYLKSVSIFEEIKDTLSIIIAYDNIGTIHYNNEQYQLSLKYLTEAREISLQTSDSSNIIYTYLNLANTYYKLNDTLNGNLNLLSAVDRLKVVSDPYISILVYHSYSDYLIAKNQKDKALEYAMLAHKIALQTQNPHNIANALIHIGEKSMLNNKYTQAEEYLAEAIKISQENNLEETLETAHFNLSQLYEKTGEYEKAFHQIFKLKPD